MTENNQSWTTENFLFALHVINTLLLAYLVAKEGMRDGNFKILNKKPGIQINAADVGDAVGYQSEDPVAKPGISATGAVRGLIDMSEKPEQSAAENVTKEEIAALTNPNTPSSKLMMLDSHMAMDIQADSILKDDRFTTFMRGNDMLAFGHSTNGNSYAWSISTEDVNMSYHFVDGKCFFRQCHDKNTDTIYVAWSDGRVNVNNEPVPEENTAACLAEGFNPQKCGHFADVVTNLNTCANRGMEKEKETLDAQYYRNQKLI